MTNIQTYRKLLPWFAKTKDGDTQLPTIVKSGLFQHDPYQIYDYCANGTTSSNGVLIQRFTPYRQQWIDLVALVKPYLPSEKDLPKRVYTVKKTEVNERKGLRWKTLHIWSNAPIEPPAVTYYQLDSLPEWISTNFDNIIIDVSAKFNTRIRTFIGVKITTHVPFNSYETYKYPGKTIQEVIEEQGTSFTGYPPSSWWETSEDLYNYDFYLTYFDIKPEWEEENTILTTSETVILPDYYYWRWTDYINLCPPIDSDNFENGYLSEFIPDLDTELTITYYVRLTKQNQWESEIIDKWLTKIRLRKGIKTAIRLPPIVLHSCQIICSSESIRNLFRDNLTKISSQLATPNLLFPDSIQSTIDKLNELNKYKFDDLVIVPDRYQGEGVVAYFNDENDPFVPSRQTITYQLVSNDFFPTDQRYKNYVFAANNNIWNIQQPTTDLNYTDADYLGDQIVIDRFFTVTSDSQDLGYTMPTPPSLLALAKAFEVEKWSVNDIDPNKDRVATLAHLIERSSQLLGYRVNANGEVDKELEKREFVRNKVSCSSTVPDEKKYGGNGFASKGMLVRRLPNHFTKDGIDDGGVVAVHDIAQLLLEILDQLNLALGVQESGAIEIRNGDEVYRYPNQLGLLTDLFIHQTNQSKYAKSTYISSLVTQEQTKEIIGGLGLPTIKKTVKMNVNGKNALLPYWGISPHTSLARKVDTCIYNVGLVLGQLI